MTGNKFDWLRRDGQGRRSEPTTDGFTLAVLVLGFIAFAVFALLAVRLAS